MHPPGIESLPEPKRGYGGGFHSVFASHVSTNFIKKKYRYTMQEGWCVSPVDKYTSHISPVHMNAQYRVVEAYDVSNVPVVSLEDQSNTAIVNGTSHEESSMSQQVVQRVFLSESELGKRKIEDDLVCAEIRSRHLLCDQKAMENEQLIITHKMENEQLIITHKMENEKKLFDNRMSTMNNFAATMDLLDPLWRQDKKLMVQAQDYVKDAIFIRSSALELENGGSESD